MAAAPAVATADEASLTGRLTLESPDDRGEAPPRAQGFIPRQRHPFKAPDAYDPRPHIVVVLQGNAAGAGDAGDIEYPITAASFASPLRPVQVGVPFEIVNRSDYAPRLYAAEDPELLPGDPIHPESSRSAAVETPHEVYRVRDRETGHIEGAIVGFPHPLFSTVDADGTFAIEGVPAGSYEARLWYRHGWLALEPMAIEISAGDEERVEISVPANLEIDDPEEGGGG